MDVNNCYVLCTMYTSQLLFPSMQSMHDVDEEMAFTIFMDMCLYIYIYIYTHGYHIMIWFYGFHWFSMILSVSRLSRNMRLDLHNFHALAWQVSHRSRSGKTLAAAVGTFTMLQIDGGHIWYIVDIKHKHKKTWIIMKQYVNNIKQYETIKLQ